MKKITVITVCRNAVSELERTMESLLKQKQCSIEYIIKDGISSDNTENLAEKYRPRFIEKGHEFRFVSKEDCGIYDAMNQALNYCSDSDYTLFLNAGDTLYDENVLTQLSGIEGNDTILLGLTYLKYSHGKKLIVEPIFENNMIEFCHQSVLIVTKVLKKYRFDTSYKIAADRELILRLISSGNSFRYLNMIISRYDCDGVSSRLFDVLYAEIDKINSIYGIAQKKHNKAINKIKVFCVQISPLLADISAIRKNIKRSRSC